MLKKFFVFTLSLSMLGSVLAAQESENIVLIDQNGKQVGSAAVKVEKDGGSAVVVAGDRNFKIQGDKIIITDDSGETKEIDISGARSVSVQQSSQTVNDNGQEKTQVHGKAIIIGPDGERQEIELGSPLEKGQFMFFGEKLPEGLVLGDEPLAFEFFQKRMPEGSQAKVQLSKYMIGVMCEPVDEQVRAHLNLENGVGLTVKSTSEDSPAAEAGVKKWDILMYADDKQLGTIADLSDVVDRAGKEGKSISITAIRKGAEVQLEITPTERPQTGEVMFAPNVQFREFGPGVIGKMDMPQDMQQQFERFQQRLEQMEKMFNERLPRPNDK